MTEHTFYPEQVIFKKNSYDENPKLYIIIGIFINSLI